MANRCSARDGRQGALTYILSQSTRRDRLGPTGYLAKRSHVVSNTKQSAMIGFEASLVTLFPLESNG